MSVGEALCPDSFARILGVVLLWVVVSVGVLSSARAALVGTALVLLWAAWAVRYRLDRTLRDRYAFFPPAGDRSRRRVVALLAALGSGAAFCGITLSVHLHFRSVAHGFGLGGEPWALAGTFLFGAVPGYFWGRYRIVSPVIVALAVYALSLAVSWSALDRRARSTDAALESPTPFEFLLLGWPYVLVVVLVVGARYGAFEYGRHGAREL